MICSNKEKTDKVINAVAAVAVIFFLSGAMLAIWIGIVGVKILLSAIVLFIGDCAASIWISTEKKKETERRRRRM